MIKTLPVSQFYVYKFILSQCPNIQNIPPSVASTPRQDLDNALRETYGVSGPARVHYCHQCSQECTALWGRLCRVHYTIYYSEEKGVTKHPKKFGLDISSKQLCVKIQGGCKLMLYSEYCESCSSYIIIARI